MSTNDVDNKTSVINLSGDCFDYVRASADHGIWSLQKGGTILEHSLLRFHVQLFLMIFLASFFNFFLKRIHIPRVSSEILAGLVLGPTVLGRVFKEQTKLLFPPITPNQVLASLSKVGLVLFVFVTAVRMDPGWIWKAGKRAIILGILLFVFPFMIGGTLEYKFDLPLSEGMKNARSTFATIYFLGVTTSQFIGVSIILLQLKITNSQLGRLALASTLLSEVARLIYSTLLGYYNAARGTTAQVAIVSFLLSLLFLSFIFLVLKPLSFWFIRNTPEGKPMRELYTTLLFSAVLIIASAGDSVGLYYLFGPFVFGLLIPAGSPLATLLIQKLDTFVSGLLIPLLTVFCSTKLDLFDFYRNFKGVLNFQITLIGYLIKLGATFIFALICQVPVRDATAYTLIVNFKGVLEIGLILSFGNLELMDLESTSGIFLILALATFIPPLVKLLYDPAKQYIGYRKKCILKASNDAELQILVCAHRQEDAMAATKLLEFSNPTKQSPLSIYGLCLEELVSSSTPLLINHQLGQKSSSLSAESRSQPILDVFRYFKSQHHEKLIQLQAYTALSPLKQMHEDICWVSFDKGASLIIVPFHKKWNTKGKIVSNSTELRNLNISVLDRAPCSVGILVDRRRTRGLSSVFMSSAIYRVATLFIGGADDREALAYGLRMAGSNRVQLTVVRFVTLTSNDDLHRDDWDKMLDSECLRPMKHETSKNNNIKYREEIVRDGSDTAAIVQSLQGSYDLIMVGRRHETEPQALSGLSEWTELPELGPIGDLLASPDITTSVSVLVMQQQIMKASHSSVLN